VRCLGIHEEERERCQGGTTLEDDDMLLDQSCSRGIEFSGIALNRRSRAQHPNFLWKRLMTGDRSHLSSTQVRSITLVDVLEHTRGFILFFSHFYLLKLT
jgi:hypothetical protein